MLPELESEADADLSYLKLPVKVHYERKGRGGREALIIKGLESLTDDALRPIAKN